MHRNVEKKVFKIASNICRLVILQRGMKTLQDSRCSCDKPNAWEQNATILFGSNILQLSLTVNAIVVCVESRCRSTMIPRT